MMDDEEEEKLEKIISEVQTEIQEPPYNQNTRSGYSREYKEYKKSREEAEKERPYVRLCKFFGGLLNLTAEESVREKLNPPLNLLNWEITPGMVLSASVGVGFLSILIWFLFFLANMTVGFLPTSVMMLLVFFPLGTAAYTFYKPVYAAKNKVIQSSGDMIMSVLYMVVYMRSSPNLEGAVRFAALNLNGPVSDDLKQVLWNLEIGKFDRIEESLEDYTRAWKDYNEDYLESLQLLKASTTEPDPRRRENMLQDAIDNILDGTREKMKHYAQDLKLPVMVLNALGAMLPVIGMVVLPIIALFLGDAVRPVHLVLFFNIMLPATLYWFMQRILSSRPPTVTFEPTDESRLPSRGSYPVEIMGKEREVPIWPLGVAIFVVLASFGMYGYYTFPALYPLQEVPQGTSLFYAGGDSKPVMLLLRSISVTAALGISIGTVKYLGNIERRKEEKKIMKIEEQFPNALFELGNKISGGTPIELALDQAAEATSDMEISELFQIASRNVKQMGMDFEQALFDDNYGALKHFPSQTIQTIMRAILEASEKGTKTASMSMTTISRYLKNIHQTREHLNDLMDETTTTIQMLAYLLAPVISAVAVGMSQTITAAMQNLVVSAEQGLGGTGSLPSAPGASLTSTLMPTDSTSSLPPEILQFVVGIYLVQLLYILGSFYTKMTMGEEKKKKNLITGKILIFGTIFYTVTLIMVSVVFGGLMTNFAP